MDAKEFIEQTGKLISDNPAKFIKIRSTFDNILGDRKLDSSKAISDREFEKLRDKFRDIDVPLSWCASKEDIYQLYKAVSHHRTEARKRDDYTAKKQAKSGKKGGLFGLFSSKK